MSKWPEPTRLQVLMINRRFMQIQRGIELEQAAEEVRLAKEGQKRQVTRRKTMALKKAKKK